MYRLLLSIVVLGAGLTAGCQIGGDMPETKAVSQPELSQERLMSLSAKSYSYGYWVNGWRRFADDPTPPLLAFESGHYGLVLNMAEMNRARFGLLDDGADYRDALVARDTRLEELAEAELVLEVDVNGEQYRAVSSKIEPYRESLVPAGAWMYEAGRIAQYFSIKELNLLNSRNERLECDGELKLVAWPDALALTGGITPTIPFKDGPVNGVSGAGHMIIDQDLSYPHQYALESDTFSLELWFHEPAAMARQNNHQWIIAKNGNEWEEGFYGFLYTPFQFQFTMNIGGGPANVFSVFAHKGKAGDSPGVWKHLVGVYDGEIMHIYLDGNHVGEQQIGRKRIPGKDLLRVGVRPDGAAHMKTPLKGMFDEIRYWNRPLSPEEIKAHYDNPSVLENRDGLAFEENFGTLPPEKKRQDWKNAKIRLALKTSAGTWEAKKSVPGTWKLNRHHSVNLFCPVVPGRVEKGTVTGTVTYRDGQQVFPVKYQDKFGGYMITVKDLKRPFEAGYVKITEYDEFDIELNYTGSGDNEVPVVIYIDQPANITGMVPMLCREDGTPTGIPIQVSKNWHHGIYLRAYAQVPVTPGPNRYKLRIPYGFYGTLPSASHAQLSLVGYGGNQRWDQVALACGGEAITFDLDMSLTDVAICDVRIPLGRLGAEGNTWGWTEAGWGGDWLRVLDTKKRALPFSLMKTAYLAHGPCLSDVEYLGAYGPGREVLLDARVQFPRTDDYGRTIQQLKYRFQAPQQTEDSYFMSKSYYIPKGVKRPSQRIAYGNGDGLIAEVQLPAGLKEGDVVMPPTEMKGPGPWWVAFPNHDPGEVTGYIAMVLRDFRASLGGKTFTHPFLELRVTGTRGNATTLGAMFVPPPEVEAYQPGDEAELNAHWLHLVRTAEDYGGPNDAYRSHLEQNPRSWKTTYREVTGNDLAVKVSGGNLLNRYPIIIESTQPKVEVKIKGGVGYVPIRFEGLQSPDGYAVYEVVRGKETKLDQSVHGNDFWQTDYDAQSKTYHMTFNLPVDGKKTSQWILKQTPGA